ncbi:hypothetical protein AOLI_G00297280 [Acnodon oligacanthus]
MRHRRWLYWDMSQLAGPQRTTKNTPTCTLALFEKQTQLAAVSSSFSGLESTCLLISSMPAHTAPAPDPMPSHLPKNHLTFSNSGQIQTSVTSRERLYGICKRSGGEREVSPFLTPSMSPR